MIPFHFPHELSISDCRLRVVVGQRVNPQIPPMNTGSPVPRAQTEQHERICGHRRNLWTLCTSRFALPSFSMAWRQRTGSTVCPACGTLVGVNDEVCYSCGRRNPALWGFSPLLRNLGRDLGFTNIVTAACVGLYLATLLAT